MGIKHHEEEQMDAMFEQFARLVHKRTERVAAGLVSGRNNLQHSHNTIAPGVAHGD